MDRTIFYGYKTDISKDQRERRHISKKLRKLQSLYDRVTVGSLYKYKYTKLR